MRWEAISIKASLFDAVVCRVTSAGKLYELMPDQPGGNLIC